MAEKNLSGYGYSQYQPKKVNKRADKNTPSADATNTMRQRANDGKDLKGGKKLSPMQMYKKGAGRLKDFMFGNNVVEKLPGTNNVNTSTLFSGKIAPEDRYDPSISKDIAASLDIRPNTKTVLDQTGKMVPLLQPTRQRGNNERPSALHSMASAVSYGMTPAKNAGESLAKLAGVETANAYQKRVVQEREDAPFNALMAQPDPNEMELLDGQRVQVQKDDDGISYSTTRGGMQGAGGRMRPGGSFSEMTSANYGGVDTSGMTREARSAFNAKSYNDEADRVKAERESELARLSPRRGGGVGQGSSYERDKLLKAYKKDLRSAMGETGHYGGTKKNKIAGINDYYKEALGLSPQVEESGKTDRAQIVADASTERGGMTQAAQMMRARMAADGKADKSIMLDELTRQPYKWGQNGERIWTTPGLTEASRRMMQIKKGGNEATTKEALSEFQQLFPGLSPEDHI